MCFFTREKSLRKAFLLLLILAVGGNFWVAFAQTKVVVRRNDTKQVSVISDDKTNDETVTEKPLVASVLPNYYDAQTGLSGLDLISRAMQSNGELVAARLEIKKRGRGSHKPACVRIRRSKLSKRAEGF